MPRENFFNFPLLLILILTIWMRFQHPSAPIGPYWYDPAVEVCDARNIDELHINHLIFPEGSREPFYSYALAFIWNFFPNLKGLYVQRVASVIIDLSAVLFFYFLGKEVANPRVGFFMAALGAVSRPMIIQCILGLRIVTVPMATALVFLTFFRLVHEPKLGRFIQWGLAMGFGLYTYTAIRPLLLFFLWLVFAWLVMNTQKEKLTRSHVTFAAMATVVCTVIFFYKNNFFPSQFKFEFENTGNMTIDPLVLFIFLITFISILVIYRKRRQREWFGWSVGMAVFCLVASPIVYHPLFATRLSEVSIFHENSNFTFGFGVLKNLFFNYKTTIKTLFFAGLDRSDMNVGTASFFEKPVSVLIMVSIIYSFIKPSKIYFLFIALAVIGMFPHFLSHDPHSGKLMGCIPPLFLLTSLVLDRFLGEIEKYVSYRKTRYFVFGGLIFIYVMTAAQTYGAVWWKYYFQKFNDVFVSELVKSDCDLYRVYLAFYPISYDFCYPESQCVLNEGEKYYYFNPPNIIPLQSPKNLRDVVVIFSGLDNLLKEKLEKSFPKAQWTAIPYSPLAANYLPRNNSVFAYRVFIPADQILRSKNAIFLPGTISSTSVVRELYFPNYGLAGGIVGAVDLSDSLTAPFPHPVKGITAKFEKNCDISGPVTARFVLHANNQTMLWFGGMKLFDVSPKIPTEFISSRIELGKGSHVVRCITYFDNDNTLPEMEIELLGGLAPSAASPSNF